MMKTYHFLIFIACVTLYACPKRAVQQEDTVVITSDQEAVSFGSECNIQAMVRDFSGMDGCRFLFVLENGDKLLPNEMPLMDFKLDNNQSIKIGYDIVRDGLSACMMESQIVKVNCIELIGQTGGVKPMKKPCIEADNYQASKWLQNMAGDMNPYMITRFVYRTDGWAYLIDNGRMKKLIDCQGTEICSTMGKALSPCVETIKNLGKGTVIHATKPPRND